MLLESNFVDLIIYSESAAAHRQERENKAFFFMRLQGTKCPHSLPQNYHPH
jgi:hypothetical protein